MYLKLACRVRVAGILVWVHQLGLQNPENRQQIQNQETGTYCVETTTIGNQERGTPAHLEVIGLLDLGH